MIAIVQSTLKDSHFSNITYKVYRPQSKAKYKNLSDIFLILTW